MARRARTSPHSQSCSTTAPAALRYDAKDPERRRSGDVRRAWRDGGHLCRQRHAERRSRWHRAGGLLRHSGGFHLVRRRHHRVPGPAIGLSFHRPRRRKTAARRWGNRWRAIPPAYGRLAASTLAPATKVTRRRPRWKSRASLSHRRTSISPWAATVTLDRDGVRHRRAQPISGEHVHVDQQPSRCSVGEPDGCSHRGFCGRRGHSRNCFERSVRHCGHSCDGAAADRP